MALTASNPSETASQNVASSTPSASPSTITIVTAINMGVDIPT